MLSITVVVSMHVCFDYFCCRQCYKDGYAKFLLSAEAVLPTGSMVLNHIAVTVTCVCQSFAWTFSSHKAKTPKPQNPRPTQMDPPGQPRIPTPKLTKAPALPKVQPAEAVSPVPPPAETRGANMQVEDFMWVPSDLQ